jgi:uncharacterized protein
MYRIITFLKPVIRFNYSHPYVLLAVAFLLSVISVIFALRLTVDTDIANLLPPTNKYVVALDELKERVGGETEMEVVIKSDSFDDNMRFARDLIYRSMQLEYPRRGNLYFSRYEFRKDTEILERYALYLATESEVNELLEYLDDEIEQAKLDANPFFIDFEEDFEDNDEEDVRKHSFEDSYGDLIPSEYPISADSTVMLIKFYPTGSRSDLRFLRDMFNDYEVLISDMNPATYNPDMVVKFGGRLQKHLLEIDSIMNDVYSSFATGISSVILLVMFYFFLKKYINYRRGDPALRKHSIWVHVARMPISTLIIGLPLFFSLTYTFAIAYFALGVLNTMTSVLFVILFGLGIDYGLHFYARYLEKRSEGIEILDALLETYESTGLAIMTSAVTTAIALFVLTYAEFRGFSEFGFISGLGIIFAYLAMIYILPAFIVFFERFGLILVNKNEGDVFVKKPPKRYPFSKTILVFGIGVILFVGFNSNKLEFEYNFGNLEAEFPEYRALRDMAREISSGTRRNPAYILADTYEEVDKIVDRLREIKEESGDATYILDVESLQERFPVTAEDEVAKLRQVALVRERLQDPFLKDQESSDLDILRKASEVTKPLDFKDLPLFLTERFVTRDGEIGRFVMIYPNRSVADGRVSIGFKNEIGTIETEDGIYHAASTSIVAAEMLDLMQDESLIMVIATFIMILILMYISFRSFRWTIISMLPLIIGLSWMFAIMILFDLSFNFYNLVVLPAILGIGNDNGVHLASRYREEGKASMWNVLSSTGQHITIGSMTTMLGFAGLLLTNHPGLFSIGLLALIGIGMTLLSAVTFLPALVQFLEDKNWIRYDY